jgi:multisubunit Na+/H+ antiporter MnhB subunit
MSGLDERLGSSLPPPELLLPASAATTGTEPPSSDDLDAGGAAAAADGASTGAATGTTDDGFLELSLAEAYADEELVLTQAVVNALYDGIWTPLSRYFVTAAEDVAGPVTARLVTYGLGISAVSTLLGLFLGMAGYRRGIYRRPTLVLGAYPRENTLYTTVMLGLAGTGVTLLAQWHLSRGKKGRKFFYSQFGRRSSRKG